MFSLASRNVAVHAYELVVTKIVYGFARREKMITGVVSINQDLESLDCKLSRHSRKSR